MISLQNITKKYGDKTVLASVSLSLSPKTITGLVGPNGSGKSTLMGIITGILPPDSGSVQFEPPLPRDKIAYVPQDIVLFEDLTLLDNLEIFGAGLGMNKSQLHQRIQNLMQETGLLENAKKIVSKLSGGQRRRANIAVALLGDPVLVVMDEPVTGVDADSIKVIQRLLLQLREKGCTLLISSHDTGFLTPLTDTVLSLEEGGVIRHVSKS